MKDTGSPTRVAIVEDDPRYRASLETLLQHTPGFELADTFLSARSLLARLKGIDPAAIPWDLVLMDLELPEIDGIQATRRVKGALPDVSVVILTSFEEPSTILQAICAGADGYLLKKAGARELVDHLRVVTRGGSSLSGEIAKSVLDVVRRFGDVSDSPPATPQRLSLTRREQDVLRCLAKGLTYKNAAAELDVTIDTVRDHVRRIYRKLHVHSAAEAVSRAVREGLI